MQSILPLAFPLAQNASTVVFSTRGHVIISFHNKGESLDMTLEVYHIKAQKSTQLFKSHKLIQEISRRVFS